MSREAARLALAALALLAACGDAGTPRVRARPNVLLVTLDTVRADRLGPWSDDARDVTPNLDDFARDAVVFTRAFANSSFTPPSHASLLTGLFPSEHGLMYWDRRLRDVPTAAERFADAGYRTLAITPLRSLFQPLGLERGFATTLAPPHREVGGQTHVADAERINAEVLPELLADDPRPYFAWVHYYDAHRPFGRQGREWATRYNDAHDLAVGATEAWYQLRPEAGRGKKAQGDLSPEDVRFLVDRYDGGLAYLDAQLGALFDALAADPRWDDTLVVVTADHGEVFDEHPEEWFSHDPYLVEENLHVPLLLRLPAGAGAPAEVDALVQGVDVLPTLLELAGVPHDPAEFSGASLVPLLAGGGLRRPALFADRMGKDETDAPGVDPAEARARRDRRRMLRTDTHKLVHHVDRGGFELFEVHDEHTDLFGADRAVDEFMLGLYERQLDALRSRDAAGGSALDAATRAQLEALGYLGGDDADQGGSR